MWIRRSGKKWAAYAYNPAKKGNQYVGTFDSQGEAKNKARTQEQQWRDRKSKPITVAGYYRVWLTLHPRPKESSEVLLRERLRPFLADFGDRDLDGGVTRVEVRAWGQGAELPDGTRFERARDWCVRSVCTFYNERFSRSTGSITRWCSSPAPSARARTAPS